MTLAEPITVYNLDVAEFDTYFVGELAVLVHNYPFGERNSSLPVPNKTIASNGLGYKSNPKHTIGRMGNNHNAEIEPCNSLKLFEKSVLGSDNHRYTFDSINKVLHRFFFDASGQLWYWSGSTADLYNPLKGNQVTIDIKRLFNLTKKGW